MRSFARLAVSGLALAWTWSGPVGGQQAIDPMTLEPHIVRVVVRAAQATAATGFVWLAPNQVVTSLHAVPQGTITVSCRGEDLPAIVSKVHVRADLALLTTPRPFSRCRPLTQALEEKPATGSKLFTLGSYQNATITSRSMTKEFASLETLSGLVTGAALNALRRFNSPAVDLDVYYVQSGALPGYSGGPVFDALGRLVGIVDGGLNKGQDGYNWVIPARHLSDLMASTVTQVPAFLAQSSAELFSAKLADDVPLLIPAASTNLRIVAGDGGGGAPPPRRVSFERTKTLSLAQLAGTAEDPDGFNSLFRHFQTTFGINIGVETQRKFDIYQEMDRDFIFATPAGAKVTLLESRYEFSVPAQGEASISVIRNFAIAAADGIGDGNGVIKASNPRFMNEMIALSLGACEGPVLAPIRRRGCLLDRPTVRMIDFGNGNKILKFGFIDGNTFAERARYRYVVLAVRGDDAFLGQFAEGTSVDLSGVFALNLMTFARLQTPGQPPLLETQFVYDSSADNPSTIRARYYDGDRALFYNERGKLWAGFEQGEWWLLLERMRDETSVYLYGPNSWFKVPIAGGFYSVSTDQGRTWRAAGAVVRR